MRKTVISAILFISMSGLFGQTPEVGQKAPDIVMKSVDGKEMKLSSLKGQMVLVDFWASWCAPCRRENPIIVETYHEYKDESFKNGEGFTVFSVSMDMNKMAWKKAIEKDSLVWPYHVSDLKGWKCEALQLYNITAVPYSFLIDGDGIIVAVNPRGNKLEKELKKVKKGSLRSIF